jgi:hypothetical protein
MSKWDFSSLSLALVEARNDHNLFVVLSDGDDLRNMKRAKAKEPDNAIFYEGERFAGD